MSNKEKFIEEIAASYTFKGNSILLGTSVLDGVPNQNNHVNAPLQTFNRHGLIAGATGTGKTKTLQVITEKLSLSGVPTLVMDIKGDLSGISQPGVMNPKIEDRIKIIGEDWKPRKCPAELLSISEEPGVKLRATISEFGPVLLSKMLELNDTQSGVVSLVFKYADDNKLPLLDIKDFRKTLQYLSNEGKEATEKEYGLISSSSVGAILRNLIALEEQGADNFFGEPSFDVDDLMRLDENGYGYININVPADGFSFTQTDCRDYSVKFYKDSSLVNRAPLELQGVNGLLALDLKVPLSMFTYIDIATSTSHTYDVYFGTDSSFVGDDGTMSINSAKLVAIQIV